VRSHPLDDQIDQVFCLTMVTNACVLWTTTCLGDALDSLRGEDVSDCLRAVTHYSDKIFESNELTALSASRPRLERGTYCLGDTFDVWPDGARCGLTRVLAAAMITGRSLT